MDDWSFSPGRVRDDGAQELPVTQGLSASAIHLDEILVMILDFHYSSRAVPLFGLVAFLVLNRQHCTDFERFQRLGVFCESG